MPAKRITKAQALHNLLICSNPSIQQQKFIAEYHEKKRLKKLPTFTEPELEKKPTYKEFISIKPHYTTAYSRPVNPEKNCNPKLPSIKPNRPDNRKFKRLQNALNYLIITSQNQQVYCKILKRLRPFKINFITLTLSQTQTHSDSEIYKLLLDPFLQWLTYEGATNYVWKAEAQNIGNIHYHITTNIYLHYKLIRDKWNYLQWKSGYLKNYEIVHGDTDANSTHVASVKNENAAKRYMSKYILKPDLFKKIYNDKTKKNEFYTSKTCEINNGYYTKDNYRQVECSDGQIREYKRKIEGRTFGYSRNLTNIKIIHEANTEDYKEYINYMSTLNPKKLTFDFVEVSYHDLIDLSKCPESLRKTILDQTQTPITRKKKKTVDTNK